MDTIKQAMSALWTLILSLVAMVISVIALVEDWLHLELNRFGVDRTTQSIIMIVTSVVLVLLAFRVLGGLLRVLMVLLLILFAIHVAIPLVPS